MVSDLNPCDEFLLVSLQVKAFYYDETNFPKSSAPAKDAAARQVGSRLLTTEIIGDYTTW